MPEKKTSRRLYYRDVFLYKGGKICRFIGIDKRVADMRVIYPFYMFDIFNPLQNLFDEQRYLCCKCGSSLMVVFTPVDLERTVNLFQQKEAD